MTLLALLLVGRGDRRSTMGARLGGAFVVGEDTIERNC